MNGSIHLHLPTQSSGAASAVIDQTVAFVRQLGARLEVSIATLDPPPTSHWAGEHYASTVLEVETGARVRATELAAATRKACKAVSLEPTLTEYRSIGLGVDRKVALLARVHDLTVMGLADGDDDTRRIIEALAFASGRPVLVVPASRSAPLNFNHIAVAWDHSEAAARAVAFAMPLLKRAKHVDVITVGSSKPVRVKDPAGRAVAHLRAHGVNAEARDVPAEGRKIGPLIMDEAIQRGAGLLVMGAYDTPRAQELIFGGVTRSMLNKPGLPLFIAN